MTLTWAGWLLLPTALVLVLVAPRLLYALMIFFIPFSATAVVNVGTHEGGSGVQAYMFLGAAWLVALIFSGLHRGSVILPKHCGHSIGFLLTFGAAAALSLAMPAVIDGSLTIASAELLHAEETPLRLGSRHFTQLAYLLFGIGLSISIAAKCASTDGLSRTLRSYLAGTACVSAWGLVQWLCYKVGIRYPAEVFNTSVTESARGYEQLITELGVQRISSAATEPSILAQSLLVIVPMLLFGSIAPKARIFSRVADNTVLILMVATLVLSTSATAYIGLAACLLIGWRQMFRLRIARVGHVAALSAGALVLSLLFLAVDPARAWVQELVLTKGGTFSGVERVASVITAWSYAREYPVLGVGWGTVTSHDLIVKLLANSGALGLASFCVFAAYLLFRTHVRKRALQEPKGTSAWLVGIATAFRIQLLLWILTGFSYVYGHVWLTIGLAMASQSGAFMARSNPRVAR